MTAAGGLAPNCILTWTLCIHATISSFGARSEGHAGTKTMLFAWSDARTTPRAASTFAHHSTPFKLDRDLSLFHYSSSLTLQAISISIAEFRHLQQRLHPSSVPIV